MASDLNYYPKTVSMPWNDSVQGHAHPAWSSTEQFHKGEKKRFDSLNDGGGAISFSVILPRSVSST